MIEKEAVLKILKDLLALAHSVEADMGSMPTAEEALESAIEQIESYSSPKAL